MSKVTSQKYVPLIGYHHTKGVIRIKDTICFRKPMGIINTRRVMSHKKYAIGMVSSHNIYRKPNTPFCRVWCHCFRESSKYLGKKPSILLSESDFVDPVSIPVFPRSKKFKWDFYYFTIGGQLGIDYKGFNVFLKSLPILCGMHKMRGIVIVYAKQKGKLPPILAKYAKYIQVLRKKIVPSRISLIMSSCKFGFFPNTVDCSPLMITESIVRDCPVLINKDILGGWKYGQNGMGLCFSQKDLDQKLNMIVNDDFSPREEYMKNYGYKNASERMSNFCKKYIPSLKHIKMLAFHKTGGMMRKYGG